MRYLSRATLLLFASVARFLPNHPFRTENNLQTRAEPHRAEHQRRADAAALSARPPLTSSTATTWTLGCPCAAALATAESKPFADGDCDRLSSLHGTSIMLQVQAETQAETPRRNRMSHSLMPPTVMSTVETVEYNFGMLRDEAVHWRARIQQPERLVLRHRCGDFRGPTWRSMTGVE